MGVQAEFIPEHRILEAIVTTALVPVLKDIEEDLGEPLPAMLKVYSGTTVGPVVVLGADQQVGSECVCGEIRLRCRTTFRKDRSVFFIEAIFENLSSRTGFSGFEINGEILLSGDDVIVNRSSHVIRHNSWEWKGWS